MAIQFWNRYTKSIETEKVYGGAGIQWAYQSALGRVLSDHLLSKKWLSKAYGYTQSQPGSAKKIASFIEQYKIDMNEFEHGPFRTFNDFFIRKFKPGKRPFAESSNVLAAPAEGRYLAFESVTPNTTFPVKGMQLTVESLLGLNVKLPNQTATKEVDKFLSALEGGPLLIARLCPVDYHRFHFPDSGTTQLSYRVQGDLHSVNTLALQEKPDILFKNEREVTLLETQNFGKMAYIEVGAMCVGKIVQTYFNPLDNPAPIQSFSRGQEKGYFLFGGSTVIVLGEKGAWKPSQDLLENTVKGVETWVKIGDGLGTALFS